MANLPRSNEAASDEESQVVQYLSSQIDPIFVPLVKTLIAKV